jgi:hypothetical protein
LSGNLPFSIGNLTSLTELYTDSNQLSGEIPSSITNLTGLTILSLSCGLTSSDLLVIAFLDEKLPGWRDRCSQSYSPSIGVVNNQDAVMVGGWTAGTELTLTVDNPANGPGVDYTTSMIFDNDHDVFYVVNEFDIQPGDIVTVTDGISTRTMTVSNVRFWGQSGYRYRLRELILPILYGSRPGWVTADGKNKKLLLVKMEIGS